MGWATTNYVLILVMLFAMEWLPDEPWAHRAVMLGMRDSDPEIRELAIAVAATGDPERWCDVLRAHAVIEPEPWLVRFCELVRL